MSKLGLVFGAVFLVISGAAQEPDAAPAGSAPASARRQGPRGAGGTREFLGLGPAPDADAAKAGAPIYKENCGACHGETGRGSQGPNLVRSTVVLHDEKGEEIGPVIIKGRPQAGMPAFPSLRPEDIYNISQYLHLQVELLANRGTYGQTYGSLRSKTSGDPQQGSAYFQANCVSCHALTGGFAKIGTKFSQAAAMQARFLWPAPQGARRATVTTQDGKAFTGSLMKFDDFNVSLRTENGEYHEWPVDRVKVAVEDKLSGHRALLPKYTDADIHNLTAYLVTLK